jgi:hypothetical protein
MSKLKAVNVVNVGDFREFREMKHNQVTYEKYLRSLGDSQLGVETNYLLDEFSNDSFGKDFSMKVKLVLTEIASRADDEWKVKIENMNHDLNTHF